MPGRPCCYLTLPLLNCQGVPRSEAVKTNLTFAANMLSSRGSSSSCSSNFCSACSSTCSSACFLLQLLLLLCRLHCPLLCLRLLLLQLLLCLLTSERFMDSFVAQLTLRVCVRVVSLCQLNKGCLTPGAMCVTLRRVSFSHAPSSSFAYRPRTSPSHPHNSPHSTERCILSGDTRSSHR